MSPWRLKIDLWTDAHGLWPVLAALLACLLLALHLGILPLLAHQADEAQTDRRALASEAPPSSSAQAAETVPAPASRFEAELADAGRRSQLIRQLWRDADKLGVRLSKLDFHEDVDQAGGFLRLRINVPVAGRYPAVKSLAFGLMKAHPLLAMDTIEIKRELASQDEVEALLHFVLMMKKAD